MFSKMENIVFFTYCTSKHWRVVVVFLHCFGIFGVAFVSLCSLHGLPRLLLYIVMCIVRTVGISSACRYVVVDIVHS